MGRGERSRLRFSYQNSEYDRDLVSVINIFCEVSRYRRRNWAGFGGSLFDPSNQEARSRWISCEFNASLVCSLSDRVSPSVHEVLGMIPNMEEEEKEEAGGKGE